MNPWFLTGFTDAEGCFTIGVVKNKKYKVGWTVKLRFQLGVNEKDKFLLLQSKNFFGVGNIYVSESAVQFIVQSVNDLAVIIKHFDKFSLITKKKIDFELFKQVFNIVINKEHITEEGLRKIVAIKASMNLGLSEELKTAFPNITPQDMPLIINQKISDPNSPPHYFFLLYKKNNLMGAGGGRWSYPPLDLQQRKVVLWFVSNNVITLDWQPSVQLTCLC